MGEAKGFVGEAERPVICSRFIGDAGRSLRTEPFNGDLTRNVLAADIWALADGFTEML
jgi:hypothetical protein